jgi:CheY-like chemotaxis protein
MHPLTRVDAPESGVTLDISLGRDSDSGRRAYLSRWVPVLPGRRTGARIPVYILVYRARLVWSRLLGYVLLLGAGPLAAFMGRLYDGEYLSIGVAVGALAAGAALLQVNPSLWTRDEYVRAEVLEGDVDVLLIENDPALAALYQNQFERDGYHVTVVKSGEEGVRRVRDLDPDIIFLSLKLPDTDSLTVVENLKRDERTRQIPIVILMWRADPDWMLLGRRMGVRDYVAGSENTPLSVSKRIPQWISG